MPESAAVAIFLSYAREDASAARRIAEALRASGLEVWFDENELVGGDAWDAKIKRQIRDCTLLLPVISQNTQRRREGYFRLEWHIAEERSRLIAKGTPFLVPVVIDDTPERDALVPEVFLAVQWTRLPGGEVTPQFAEVVKRLVGGGAAARAVGTGPTSARPATNEVRRRVAAGAWLGAAAIVVLGVAVAFFVSRKAEPNAVAGTSLSTAEKPAAPAPMTESRKLAQQARKLYEQWDFATREDFDLAEQLLKRAADLDPSDGEVWATYAMLSCAYQVFAYDTSTQRNLLARTHALRALKLAPDSGLGRFAHAFTFRFEPGMRGECIRLMKEEAARRPTDHFLIRTLASNLRVFGRHEESLPYFEQALALAPNDPITHFNRSAAFQGLGRVPEAETDLDRALALAPNFPQAQTSKLMLLLGRDDDLAATKAYLAKMPRTFVSNDSTAVRMAKVCLYVREPAKALDALRLTNDVILNAQFSGPKRYLTGLAHWVMGNQDAARSEWRAALKTVEAQIAAQANTASWLMWKAELLAALAQKAEAEILLRELVQRAAADNQFDRSDLAKVHVWLGDKQAALATLEQIYRQGVSRWSRTYFRHDPVWEPLRGEPRFEALLNAPKAKK